MDELYLLQYDDDPYCAPYVKRIYADKTKAFQYGRKEALKHNSNFRCVEVWAYNNGCWREDKSYSYNRDTSSWE